MRRSRRDDVWPGAHAPRDDRDDEAEPTDHHVLQRLQDLTRSLGRDLDRIRVQVEGDRDADRARDRHPRAANQREAKREPRRGRIEERGHRNRHHTAEDQNEAAGLRERSKLCPRRVRRSERTGRRRQVGQFQRLVDQHASEGQKEEHPHRGEHIEAATFEAVA